MLSRDNKAFAALGRFVGANTALAEATDAINDHQVHRLHRAVEARAAAGATVAVLGMAYKPATGVIEASQGVMLARVLIDDGYRVLIADPQASAAAEAELGHRVEAATAEEAIAQADVVVVTTPWPEFAAIPTDAFRRPAGRVTVIDPWRLFDAEAVGRGGRSGASRRGNSAIGGRENGRPADDDCPLRHHHSLGSGKGPYHARRHE